MCTRKGMTDGFGSARILELPLEIFVEIAVYLSVAEKFKIGRVCQQWYRYTRSQACWKQIYIPQFEKQNDRDGHPQRPSGPMPVSALHNMLSWSKGVVQRADIACLGPDVLEQCLHHLIRANWQTLLTLRVHDWSADLSDKGGGDEVVYMEDLEEDDERYMEMLANVSCCTHLRELSLSHVRPVIGQVDVKLSSLRTLILGVPDLGGYSLEHRVYELRPMPSLTKLVLYNVEETRGLLFFHDIQQSAPALQILYVQGMYFGSPEDTYKSADGEEIQSQGVHALDNLQELSMFECDYSLAGPLPSGLRSLRIAETELRTEAMYQWQGTRLCYLNEVQFEDNYICDKNSTISTIPSLEFLMRLLETRRAIGDELIDGESPPINRLEILDTQPRPLTSLRVSLDGFAPETTVNDKWFLRLMEEHGQELVQLHLSDVKIQYDNFIPEIITECKQLESLTISDCAGLGDCQAVRSSLCNIKLKEFRLWSCAIQRLEAEALMNECTAQGIRFEWLPKQGAVGRPLLTSAAYERMVSRKRAEDWERPIYNWRSTLRADRYLGVVPFDPDVGEVEDWHYCLTPPTRAAHVRTIVQV